MYIRCVDLFNFHSETLSLRLFGGAVLHIKITARLSTHEETALAGAFEVINSAAYSKFVVFQLPLLTLPCCLTVVFFWEIIEINAPMLNLGHLPSLQSFCFYIYPA